MENNQEIKNGLGLAYRSLETDLNDLESKWQEGTTRLLKAEIEHKQEGLAKIVELTEKLRVVLLKFKKITNDTNQN